MHLVKTVNTRASREAAWTVVTTVEKMPAWTASMTRVRPLDGGALRVGSRVHIEQPGLRPMTWTVTELDVGKRFTWEAGGPGIRIVASHAIEADGNALALTGEIRMSGWLVPVLAPFISGRTWRYLVMETEGWARRSETMTGTPGA